MCIRDSFNTVFSATTVIRLTRIPVSVCDDVAEDVNKGLAVLEFPLHSRQNRPSLGAPHDFLCRRLFLAVADRGDVTAFGFAPLTPIAVRLLSCVLEKEVLNSSPVICQKKRCSWSLENWTKTFVKEKGSRTVNNILLANKNAWLRKLYFFQIKISPTFWTFMKIKVMLLESRSINESNGIGETGVIWPLFFPMALNLKSEIFLYFFWCWGREQNQGFHMVPVSYTHLTLPTILLV